MPDLDRAGGKRNPLPRHFVDYDLPRVFPATLALYNRARRNPDQRGPQRGQRSYQGQLRTAQMRRPRREKPYHRRCERRPRSGSSPDEPDPEKSPDRPRPPAFSLPCLNWTRGHRPHGARFPYPVPQAPLDRAQVRISDKRHLPTYPDLSAGTGRCKTENTRPERSPVSGRSGSATPSFVFPSHYSALAEITLATTS